MKNIAFIFARGGSKGLPGKNIKELNGKPLLAWSIEVAAQSGHFAEIFVSTDDAGIANVATEFGATVINRPEELASDISPEWLSWRHAIHWVKENRGEFDTFVSLPATSPLRSVVDINSALSALNSSDADLCIGITEANRSPYFNMVTKDNNGQLDLVIRSKGNVTRRQDAPAVYDITTVVYAANPEFILNSDSIFSGKVIGVEIDKNRAVDIDDEVDFMLAEALMKQRDIVDER